MAHKSLRTARPILTPQLISQKPSCRIRHIASDLEATFQKALIGPKKKVKP